MARFSPVRLAFARRRRRDAYLKVFDSIEGQIVLDDLMKECGWDKDLFNPDPGIMANLTGRRFPILHIKAICKYTNEQLDELSKNHRDEEERFPE